MDRREFLRVAAGAGLGLAATSLLGCQPQQTPPETAKPAPAAAPKPAAAPSKPTGRLVFAFGAVGPSTDPHTIRSVPYTTMAATMFDSVTRLNSANGQAEPSLAESWRTVDNRTVEFKLRRGVPFHNGRELTAQDVKFSIERLLDPAQNKGLTAAGNVVSLSHVEVVDSYTCRMVAKDDNPIIPVLISRVFILPGAEFKAAGDPATFFAKPIGSGPFAFKAFERDTYLEVVATESSWRKPKLAEIRFQALKEDAARVAALSGGQVDAIDNLPTDQVQRVEAAGFQITWGPQTSNFTLDLFAPPGNANNKIEVRRAIAHAIDWNAIVKEIYRGYAKINNGLTGGPGALGWADDPVKYPYDPAKAKQLLAQAGYPNGFKTKLQGSRGFMINDVTTAEAIVGYLKAVGIEADMTAHEFSTFLQVYLATHEKGRPPLFIHRQSYDVTMDLAFWLTQFDDKKSTHPYGWNDPEFVGLIARAQKEMDRQRREQLVLQGNRLILDQAIAIAGLHLPYILAHSRKVSGLKPPPDSLIWMDDVVKSA